MSSRLSRRIKELNEIDGLLDALRLRLPTVPTFCREDLAGDLRELADLLSPTLNALTVPSTATSDETEDATVSVASRMREWLFGRNNDPATIQEIADGVGAQHESVKSVLYKRNRGRFTQVRGASPGHPALWRATAVQVPEEGATGQEGDASMF